MKDSTNQFSNKLNNIQSGLIAVLGIGFFINLLMLSTPLFMLQVYDRVLISRSTDTLLLLVLIVGAALITIAVLETARTGIMDRLSSWISRSLSSDSLSLTIRRTLRQEQSASVQSLRDLDSLRNFLTSPAIFSLIDSPWSFIYLATIFLLHPLLGWTTLVGAIVLLIMAVTNDRLTREGQKEAAEANILALRQAESAVRNADVVEAMGMEQNLLNRWQAANSDVLEKQSRTSRRSSKLSASSKAIRLGLQSGILGLGALLAIKGEMTAGAIIAASILAGRALSPVDQSISTWRSSLSAKEAYNRLLHHFEKQTLDTDKMSLPRPKGEIAVENLSFAFQGAREPIIKNINFSLSPGESLAVIGPSGSGKTTLVRQLLGNLTPLTGHARIDGMDISQWQVNDRGQYIGYLPQDVELFAGTVQENIARMSQGDANAVIEAAKLADVHEMVMRFPEGYDTEIGVNGIALSGGQRQRIALARALYGNPAFVLLDEPNANLDQEGDAALEKAMKKLKARGVTTVLVTHRPAVLNLVDKVLFLQNGMIRAFGPKDEVLKSNPNQQTSQPTPTLLATNTYQKISYDIGKTDVC